MTPWFGRRSRDETRTPASAAASVPPPVEPAPGPPVPRAAPAEPRWIIVVPVKPSARGKSRLDVPGVDRADLARAIALDTLAAATRCALVLQVVVVTDDSALARHSADIPALRFVPEGDAAGLDAAVAAGFAAVDATGRLPRAALLGDLPALRPEDLAAALRAAASVDRGVVSDTEGTGSTLVTARAGVTWSSSFGEGSFARHTTSGCVALEIPDASTLRRDVDTAAQLDVATSLGVGPRTAAILGLG